MKPTRDQLLLAIGALVGEREQALADLEDAQRSDCPDELDPQAGRFYRRCAEDLSAVIAWLRAEATPADEHTSRSVEPTDAELENARRIVRHVRQWTRLHSSPSERMLRSLEQTHKQLERYGASRNQPGCSTCARWRGGDDT